MEAFGIGLLYALVGVILLFFGARFITLVLGVLGGMFGASLGQLAVVWWGFHGIWAFLLIVACAALIAYLSIRFYVLCIAGGAGYFLGLLVYALALQWQASHSWAITLGVFFAVIGFLVVWKLNLVENMFKFLTAIQGAIALVGGVYVLLHSARVDTLQTNFYNVLLGASFWWVTVWILLFCAGFGYQLRAHSDFFTR